MSEELLQSYFSANGTIKLAIKQGRKVKDKDVTEENKRKEICLNCDAPECNGVCSKIRRKARC
nr:MAG TPA: hypothetical protein [Caudoviricetes sp.]